MNNKTKFTFFIPKRAELLRRISNQNNYKKSLGKLHKGIYTYVSCIKVINIFEDAGLITTRPVGRERYVELTGKGKEILKNLKICGCLENEKKI